MQRKRQRTFTTSWHDEILAQDASKCSSSKRLSIIKSNTLANIESHQNRSMRRRSSAKGIESKDGSMVANDKKSSVNNSIRTRRSRGSIQKRASLIAGETSKAVEDMAAGKSTEKRGAERIKKMSSPTLQRGSSQHSGLPHASKNQAEENGVGNSADLDLKLKKRASELRSALNYANGDALLSKLVSCFLSGWFSFFNGIYH